MTSEGQDKRAQRRRLLIALIALVVIAFAGVMLYLARSGASGAGGEYQAAVAEALAEADALRGEELSEELECNFCHLRGDGTTAPLFYGLADVAGQRRADLPAEQYLYEAILYPAAHLVEGFTDSMPYDYGERLTAQEIGHLIAFLQTFSDQQ